MAHELIYDVEKRQITELKQMGVSGFMSYNRLLSTLRDAGEFEKDETVLQLQFRDNGIVFVFGYAK